MALINELSRRTGIQQSLVPADFVALLTMQIVGLTVSAPAMNTTKNFPLAELAVFAVLDTTQNFVLADSALSLNTTQTLALVYSAAELMTIHNTAVETANFVNLFAKD